MTNNELPIEFRNETELNKDAEYRLYVEAEERLHKLAKGHTDITGAAIHLTTPAEARETQFIYEAQVVLYSRPTNTVAVEKGDQAMGALKGALSAVERQVRERREELRGY